jgi:hypothetical protein
MSVRNQANGPVLIRVRQDGSGDFTDPQAAMNYAADGIDAAGNQVVVQLGPGIWTGAIELLDVVGARAGGWQQKKLLLQGWGALTGNLSDCVLTSAHPTATVFNINCHSGWYVEGFTIENTGIGACIQSHAGGSMLYAGKNRYGQMTAGHLGAAYGATLEVCDSYEVTAGGLYHFALTQGGKLIGNPVTVTLNNNPAFVGPQQNSGGQPGAFLWCMDGGLFSLNGMQFVGPAQGYQFLVDFGGGVKTLLPSPANTSVWPGTLPGRVGTFGAPWLY